ncbi:benzoate/H(+) symporter BenE family transporter [Jeotgalicoccus marinus]|uniref:benzoate/H(+) symporter BenE family transporter n=1 Tax=Jeotgalicoccus marinus TaxID=516700 RepID=UPI00047A1E28|nr:benzoate/H(+) symporter BenE family transporter [Jeotgalicoccus marinus]
MKYTIHKPAFLNDINRDNISGGLMTGMLGIIGPPVMVIEAANAGMFSHEQTITWFYGVHFFGALLGMIMSIYYRMPIVGAHSLTGVAFLVTVTPHFTFEELVGSYIITALIIMAFGMSGIFKKVMSWIPREIIAAMLAGIISSYVFGLIPATVDMPIIGITAIVAFFIFRKWDLRIPPMLAGVFTAVIMYFVLNNFDFSALGTTPVMPTFTAPEFSISAIISVTLPLTLLILSNDATPAIGALESNGYKVPINSILTFSGIASLGATIFGGQSANVGGMMTTIASDHASGEKSTRYVASVISSIVMLIFAIFAWALVPLMFDLPASLMSILTGFVLIGVFASTLRRSFSNPKYTMSVIFTFIIAASGVTYFYISAPIWAMLIGTLVAKFIED